MGVIKATLPDQVLINFYTALNEDGFWSALGQKIYGPGMLLTLCDAVRVTRAVTRCADCLPHSLKPIGSESSFEDASAFFNRLVDLCSTQNNADVLFQHLSQDMGFLDGLVDCISNNTGNLPAEQQVPTPFSASD
jgi:hypothetical protein